MTTSLQSETFEAGFIPGAGSFACVGCEAAVMLTALDALPECPQCGGTAFHRASMFEHAVPHEPPTAEEDADPAFSPSDWLDEMRGKLDGPGHFIAFYGDDGATLLPLEEGWTRIGRSATADICIDDPTVSRRHALIVSQAGQVRVLDDRSLNGIYVNGEEVDWMPLSDGDELAIGRYRLHFLEA
jgi:FHA domain-containing protein/zinc ribbon family protein